MPTWNDWIRICYHEAGHAVATLAVGHSSAPIFLRCIANAAGELEAQGTFTSSVRVAHDVSYTDLLHKLAAGRVAEEIRFGDHGVGVTSDMTKVDIIAKIATINGDPSWVQEKQNGFRSTHAVLQINWTSVVRIAEISMRRVRSLKLENTAFANRMILSENAVERIFRNSPLSADENAKARVAAFYYSIERGNGTLPPFSPQDAQDDFERATGDILGATP